MVNIYNRIRNNYKNENYKEVVKAMDEYLNIPSIGLDTEIIHYYAISIIQLGREEEGFNILNKYSDFYKKAIYNVKQAIELIKNEDYKNASVILENVAIKYPYYDSVYYHLCMIYAKTENFDKARVTLGKLIEFSKNNFLIETTRKLINFYEFEEIEDIRYKYLKEQNIPLKPGYIVRLKSGTITNINLFREKPLLIYKIENDTIYAFPIRYNINKKFYVLPSINGEKVQLAPELVTFNKQGILRVEYNITDDVLRLCLIDVYYRYLTLNKNNNLEEDIFVKDMQKIIKKS